MSRVLMYSGEPLLLETLVFARNSSLAGQDPNPEQLRTLDLCGFGVAAWDPGSPNPEQPFLYHSPALPLHDPNLRALGPKVRARTMLAHVRGVPHDCPCNTNRENLHPFRFDRYAWAMAHNGVLSGYSAARHAISRHLSPDVAKEIAGDSDSELLYALIMSQLADPHADREPDTLIDAMLRALRIVRHIRKEQGEAVDSCMNLFFTNGEDLVALRFSFDYGCYAVDSPHRVHESSSRYMSVWYALGEHYAKGETGWTMTGDPQQTKTALISSRPLAGSPDDWHELSEYTVLSIRRRGGALEFSTRPIDV